MCTGNDRFRGNDRYSGLQGPDHFFRYIRRLLYFASSKNITLKKLPPKGPSRQKFLVHLNTSFENSKKLKALLDFAIAVKNIPVWD